MLAATTTNNWFEQSKEEGRKEGEVTLLIRLLEKKFGVLETQTRASFFKLDAETLLKYADRLLAAKTIQEVIKQ